MAGDDAKAAKAAAKEEAARAKDLERKQKARAKADDDRLRRVQKAAKDEAKAQEQAKKDAARAERERARSLKGDRSRKLLLDGLILLVLALLVAVILSALGLVPLQIAGQTYALAAATAVLAGSSYLFNTIRWRDIREEGAKAIHRGKADIQLTIVSIAALVTVVLMAVVEAFALLYFLGVLTNIGAAGFGFVANFVLFQTMMLLVYLAALVSRENNPSRFVPKPAARAVANALTPLAGLVLVLGVLIAAGIVSPAGIEPRQGVYVVTLAVLLEFIAMRVRLRLPSLWSLFSGALAQAKRPNEEMKDVLRKRAQRTYIAASVFVALSMAFAGAVVTGTVGLADTRIVASLVIFYVGTAVILLGMVGIRYLQARALAGPKRLGDDELSRLVSQRRRSAEDVLKISVYVVTGFLSLVAGLLCVLTFLGNMPWNPKFGTDLFILAAMFGAGPFGYFHNREAKRIAAVDEKFPDFLRDIAESARAGMTLPRALVTAAQGSYGALTPEIKKMAAQVEWGIDFGDALSRFAGRCKTPLIDRTVSLVVEAQRSGGSVVDILTAASEDAREIKQIVSERNTQMSMYNVVIYISFFVFIVVVLVLSAQFIPAFKKAVGAAAGSGQQQVGGLHFVDFDPETFNTIFFQAAVVQAIGGGLVGGVLTKGNPVAGFIHIAVMLAVAWLSFRVLVGFL